MTNKSFGLPKFEPDCRPSPTRRLLEETRISKLPPLPHRAKTTAAICGNCQKRLDASNEYQTAVGFCKSCLRTCAVVGVGVEKYTESKIRRNYLEGK